VSTHKATALTTPQQPNCKVQTPTKPLQAKTDKKKTPPTQGEQQLKKVPNQHKGKGNSKPKMVTIEQKTVHVNKQIASRAKQADKTDSPTSTMKATFDEVTKLSKTTERIVETPDSKSYQLLSEEEKRKFDAAKKFEALGTLHFSDDEDDELSLVTVTSNKSKGSNKSQGSQKPVAKPKPKQPTAPKQPNTAMPRSASKQVKEDETVPFHRDALASAGSLTTPEAKGSSAGGWTAPKSGKRVPNICANLTPKGVGNMLGMWDPTPPNSDSDSGSAGSNKNSFAALQEDDEEEVSDATTAILPVGEIAEMIQEGAVLTQADSNEVPDNIQAEVAKPEVEGGNVPRDNDPQPDGVASSLEADFIKAKSE